MGCSHNCPSYPGKHKHENAFTLMFPPDVESVQVAPFVHGLLAHSSTSKSHRAPSVTLHNDDSLAADSHVPFA